MEGYRLLEHGEVIQEGDEFRSIDCSYWMEFSYFSFGHKWLLDKNAEARRKVIETDYLTIKNAFDKVGVKYDDINRSIAVYSQVIDKISLTFNFDKDGKLTTVV